MKRLKAKIMENQLIEPQLTFPMNFGEFSVLAFKFSVITK